jgi:CTP synthase
MQTRTKIEIVYVDAENVETEGVGLLCAADAIIVPGGFGQRGTSGKINAVKYARLNDIPYLGICLGMQIAMIEFARNVLNLEGAHSTEFDSNTPHPVIALVSEWRTLDGVLETRTENDQMGGTLRLGAQCATLSPNSFVQKIYGQSTIQERHRHRYEFNNLYRTQFEQAGMKFSGLSDDDLVETVELPSHKWFVGCQFHPEFTSTPRKGHPLFTNFVEAARQHKHSVTIHKRVAVH